MSRQSDVQEPRESTETLRVQPSERRCTGRKSHELRCTRCKTHGSWVSEDNSVPRRTVLN